MHHRTPKKALCRQVAASRRFASAHTPCRIEKVSLDLDQQKSSFASEKQEKAKTTHWLLQKKSFKIVWRKNSGFQSFQDEMQLVTCQRFVFLLRTKQVRLVETKQQMPLKKKSTWHPLINRNFLVLSWKIKRKNPTTSPLHLPLLRTFQSLPPQFSKLQTKVLSGIAVGLAATCF